MLEPREKQIGGFVVPKEEPPVPTPFSSVQEVQIWLWWKFFYLDLEQPTYERDAVEAMTDGFCSDCSGHDFFCVNREAMEAVLGWRGRDIHVDLHWRSPYGAVCLRWCDPGFKRVFC